MNELIMRALSYVDDRWITEAMSDYETVKMKHFFIDVLNNINLPPFYFYLYQEPYAVIYSVSIGYSLFDTLFPLLPSVV